MTKNQNSPYGGRSKELDEAREALEQSWLDLAKDLTQYQLNDRTLRLMAVVHDAFSALVDSELVDERDAELLRKDARRQAQTGNNGSVSRSQQGERHDGKEAKSGYVYRLGAGLARLRGESGRALAMARAITENLQSRSLPFGRGLHSVSEGLERAHLDVVGYPFGEPWYGLLVYRLEKQAFHLEDERMRHVKKDSERERWEAVWRAGLRKSDGWLGQVVRGERPDWSATRLATGAEVLEDISRVHAVPPELTAVVIEGMIASVGLNKGGQHKKRLAASLVAEFWAGVKKQRKAAERSRGNSRA